MVAQTFPLGINLSSPLVWFVIVVALIVLALTVTTRRAVSGPRAVHPPRGPSNRESAPVQASTRTRYADAWSAAQARFVEDPRAGCVLAQTIVTELVAERGFGALQPAERETRWHAARAVVADRRSSTDELRAAFMTFRALFEARIDGVATEAKADAAR